MHTTKHLGDNTLICI